MVDRLLECRTLLTPGMGAFHSALSVISGAIYACIAEDKLIGKIVLSRMYCTYKGEGRGDRDEDQL